MARQNTDRNVVATTKLTKVFRDFWLREKVTAVADLDLEIRPGEVFGLLGPNGSGKTTTLKMILGLLFPTRGHIAVFGRRPTDVATKKRIGFLPEDSYLYPFLDARETLDFYGRLFHQPRQERLRRTDMLLDMVGLRGVAYRRVGEYSKGMQRRIGLAQALINDPDLLILDEPTGGMDPIGTRQFKDLISLLAQRGKTVILSSHLLADVEDVCDRVCILYGGKQRALGEVDDLLARGGLTQITTEQLDQQTLEKVQQALEASGRDVVEVTTPRTSLEALFLQIVEDAQRQRVRTGGAVGTGKVADFLQASGEEGREVIDQLVSRQEIESQPEETGQTEQPHPEEAEPTEEVLEDLLAGRSEEPADESADKDRSESGQADRSEQADQDVLKELLGRDEEEDGDSDRRDGSRERQ